MNFLLENRNKLSWLAGDWLQQDMDSMKMYSGGLSCNLPTASVRAAFPVVEDILSSQPVKQFSLLLPPELSFGHEELGSLEAFLTSGKMPLLPLEQIKKMKAFLEETCSSQIQLAVSKSKIYNDNVERTILEPVNITEEENDFPNIETVRRDSTDEVPPVKVEPTSQERAASVTIGFADDQALFEHKARCEELSFDGDEEGEGSRKKNTEGETFEVKEIISRKEREGGEKFEVLWKEGNVSWESRSDLKGADEAIKDFFRREHEEFFKSLERCLEPGCHNIGFQSKEGLKHHRKKFHERPAAETPSRAQNRHKHKCISCDDKSFPNKIQLVQHKEREHLGLFYKCGDCQTIFTLKNQAVKHASKSGHSKDGIVKVKDIHWDD